MMQLSCMLFRAYNTIGKDISMHEPQCQYRCNFHYFHVVSCYSVYKYSAEETVLCTLQIYAVLAHVVVFLEGPSNMCSVYFLLFFLIQVKLSKHANKEPGFSWTSSVFCSRIGRIRGWDYWLLGSWWILPSVFTCCFYDFEQEEVWEASGASQQGTKSATSLVSVPHLLVYFCVSALGPPSKQLGIMNVWDDEEEQLTTYMAFNLKWHVCSSPFYRLSHVLLYFTCNEGLNH